MNVNHNVALAKASSTIAKLSTPATVRIECFAVLLLDLPKWNARILARAGTA